MQEVSNRTLPYLLVLAIVVSLFGTFISLNKIGRIRGADATGFVFLTDENATISLEVSSITAVNFTVHDIAWGAGAVDPGTLGCRITSQGYNGSAAGDYGLSGNNCTINQFENVTHGLILENIGNKNVTLNLSCGSNAQNLIGGTSPLYQWNVSSDGVEANSCMNLAQADGLLQLAPSFQNCYDNVSNGWGHPVCNETRGGFNSENYADTLRFDINIYIPEDAIPEAKSDTITAIIEAI